MTALINSDRSTDTKGKPFVMGPQNIMGCWDFYFKFALTEVNKWSVFRVFLSSNDFPYSLRELPKKMQLNYGFLP